MTRATALGIFVYLVIIDYHGAIKPMGLANMTFYRVKKLLAWFFAVVILTLLAAGAFWVITELGWLA